MERDYSITIFSRHKGKTLTFDLSRRVIYLPLIMLVILVVGCILFGQAYFQERQKRQRLEGRVALFERLMSSERLGRQGGVAPAKAIAEPEAEIKPRAEVAVVGEKVVTPSEARAAPLEIGSAR